MKIIRTFLDEGFVKYLEALGDVLVVEEVEDGREPPQNKSSTLTQSSLREKSLFLALEFLEERFP